MNALKIMKNALKTLKKRIGNRLIKKMDKKREKNQVYSQHSGSAM